MMMQNSTSGGHFYEIGEEKRWVLSGFFVGICEERQ
jgi:hypothetical protein